MHLFSPQRQITTGTYTNSVSATSVFTFSHNMNTSPSHVSITPKNTTSSPMFYTTWDDTNITVTYAANVTGTVLFSWQAIAA
jgi:hypothetical protein